MNRARSFVFCLLVLALAAGAVPLGASPAGGAASPPQLSFLSCPAPQLTSALDWTVIGQPVEGPVETTDPEPIDPNGICNCKVDGDCAGLKCTRGTAVCLIALYCDNGYRGSCRCPS